MALEMERDYGLLTAADPRLVKSDPAPKRQLVDGTVMDITEAERALEGFPAAGTRSISEADAIAWLLGRVMDLEARLSVLESP